MMMVTSLSSCQLLSSTSHRQELVILVLFDCYRFFGVVPNRVGDVSCLTRWQCMITSGPRKSLEGTTPLGLHPL